MRTAKETRRIFNHDILDCSADESLKRVVGVNHYGGRALGCTKAGDIIQLNPDLSSHWDWINDHYSQAGIEHADTVIWDDDFEKIKDFSSYEPDVFFFGKRANMVRPDEKWFGAVEKMNSKNNFILLCRSLGISVPETWIFNCKSGVTDLGVFPFPCYLKLSVSVSGLGVYRCENKKELECLLEEMKEGVPFQIQESLPAKVFLNVQYRINGKLERGLITEQVLKGNCHAGNAFPSKYAPWEITDPIAKYMATIGMKGFFAFDVAVHEDQSGNVFSWAIECNPRYNGSNYPAGIALKIGAKSWVAKKVNTSVGSFSGIDLGDLVFSSKKGCGVVVINWGSITEKEISVLFVAQTEAEMNKLEERLLKVV